MPTRGRTLLLVDDEEGILHALSRLLHKEGYRLLTAGSGEDALRLLQEQEVHVILSDQRMPGMSGVELLTWVKAQYPDIIRMVLSGYADIEAVSEAINQGQVYKFLFKPWQNDALLATLREAFAQFEAKASDSQLARIYENSAEGVMVTDRDCIILRVNPAFTALTGFTPEEAIGKTPAILNSGRHPPAFFQAMATCLREQGRWAGEVWNRRKNGEIFPAWLSIACLREGRSGDEHYVATFSDISDYVRQEEAVRAQIQLEATASAPVDDASWVDKI